MKQLKNLIIKEFAKQQMQKAQKILKEAPEPPSIVNKPEKNPVDQKQDDTYESYLLVFDALNKSHEALKKLVEADKILSNYDDDASVQKVLTVIGNAIQNDLSPVIDRFSAMMRVLKRLAL